MCDVMGKSKYEGEGVFLQGKWIWKEISNMKWLFLLSMPRENCFCLPIIYPNIFSSFIRVHLSLQTLFTFVLTKKYLILTLWLPMAHIKLLSSFIILYLTTDLPILNSLARSLFSIYQHERSILSSLTFMDCGIFNK